MTVRSQATRSAGRAVGLALLAALLASALPAQVAGPAAAPGTLDLTDPSRLPADLRDIGWDQRLGETLDLEAPLVDHQGRAVSLGDVVAGDRPVLLAPVYFHCPMLCSMVLEGVIRNLLPLSLDPGEDFDLVAISFDPRDTPETAAEMRAEMLERYRREPDQQGFHFLTGEQEVVAGLMEQLGVRYAYDERTGLYTHAGGVAVLTPDGTISRYFFGIDFPSKDLRLGLVEASEGRIGNLIDQVLLYCYRYDPVTGQYSAVTMNIIRLGGLVTVILLFGFIATMLLRERRRDRLANA